LEKLVFIRNHTPMTATTSSTRHSVRFLSGDAECAAWHYPGSSGACIVMGCGTGVTKEPGTDRFAPRFQSAGYTVLALDFRRLGESGGGPRQLVRVNDQVADFGAAVAFAGTLPEVDPARIALWGFSLAGGHVLRAAAQHPELAAAILQAPFIDGPAIGPNAFRCMTARSASSLMLLAARDVLRRRVLRRPPMLVALSGPRGAVASVTTPDGARGATALDPDGRYAGWEQTVAAGSAVRLGLYRPGRVTRRVRCPLLFVVYAHDRTVLAAPARTAAARAPRGELLALEGDHYAAFDGQHDATVDGELAFLRRHLLGPAGDGRATRSGGRASPRTDRSGDARRPTVDAPL
jgi:pimeloyl-ACP methyl ester carboxylesterase